MLTPSYFIPLDRRFERAGEADPADYWAEALSDPKMPRDWKWLRAQSHVIALLAQAGSGKTVEFQHQVDTARQAGRHAFFFRVERLCSDNLEDAHETAHCRVLFDQWLNGSERADIFLDAVDEAKLPRAQTARPLRDALRKLEFALSPHLARVSFFVSCRSSEWHDETEQRAMEDVAQAISAASPAAEPVKVFGATFSALDIPRIRLLAQEQGGDEAVNALIESEAIADIVTPLDATLHLETFCAFRGAADLAERFASRGQLLETSIKRRLVERGADVRRSQVEFTVALKAAQFLAFASTVAQTLDLAIGTPRQGATDPYELLSSGHASLSTDSVRQLLACSLFVPSGQGRVRFYRREARDMLAAQWLRDRIEEGGSPLAVTNRFIKTAFGPQRVPNAYGSMLAWLGSYDPVTLRRMISAAPEWIIEGGDARNLALDDRISAFRRHFQLGPDRFHGDFVFDVGELRRFARPELEDVIVSMLKELPAGDLFDNLMQMIEAGRYASAAAELVDISKDFSRSAGDRMFVIRALIACGDSGHLGDVARHFAGTGGPAISSTEPFALSRNDQFLLDLVMAAYPKAIGTTEALELLRQLHGKEYAYEAKALARWLHSVVPPHDLEAWLLGLSQLCFDDSQPYHRYGNEAPALHRQAFTLLRGLVDIMARYIRESTQFNLSRDIEIYDKARYATHLGGAFSMSGRASPIPKALIARLEFRRALYDDISKVENSRWTFLTYFEHLGWSFYDKAVAQEDLNWLIDGYREGERGRRAEYAQSALRVANRLPGSLERVRARMSVVRTAMAAPLQDWSILKQALFDPILAPFNRFWTRRRHRGIGRGHDAKAIRLLRKIASRFDLWRKGPKIRQGTAQELLVQLVLADGHEIPTEQDLRARLGNALGDDVISGAIAFAQGYRPMKRGRTVLTTDILAQAGYRYSWNKDRRMSAVDPETGLRSALYFALDWPEWATELALNHPKAWVNVAVPLIVKEIAESWPSENSEYTPYLSSISRLEEDVRSPLAAPIFAAIRNIRVIDGLDLTRLVSVLGVDPAVGAELPLFAARHAREAWHEGSVRRAMKWLPLWSVGDEAGLRTLLAWMEIDASLVLDGLSIYVQQYADNSSASRPSLDIRSRFAVLAYSHIDPKTDLPFQEGPRSLTARDDYQQLRSATGDLLNVAFDDAERAALEEILVTYIEPVSSGWAMRWRNRYAQLAVKPAPWSTKMIVDASRELAEPPRTGDQLYSRVSEMIVDLERELATVEFDRRGLFSSEILESDFRAWLGHEMDRQRRPWFSLVQEAETSAAKRTDLRIELRGAEHPVVVVEIKLFHGWNYEELIDKFQSQLVDQYLLSPRVRHGIYLIVDLGKNPKNKMADGTTPGSAEIAALINADATAMAASGGPLAKAQVFTITPTKRNVRRAAATSSGKSKPS